MLALTLALLAAAPGLEAAAPHPSSRLEGAARKGGTAPAPQVSSPADALDALDALAAFGEIPACEVTIVRAGTQVRTELSSPPVPRLKERSRQLLPFLEHPDRRVVERAVRLLCAAGDRRARGALEQLSLRLPCAGLVREERIRADVAEEAPEPPACARAAELRRVTTPADWSRWRTPRSDALARAIAAGDPAAVATASSDLEAIDFERQRLAKAALASVDTLAGWVRFTRTAALPLRDGTTHADWQVRVEIGDVQLGNAARKDGRPLAEELLAAAELAPELTDELDWVSYQHPGVRRALEAHAAAARTNGSISPGLRAWFERLDSSAALDDPGGYAVIADRLAALFRERQVGQLRAFMRSPAQARLHRLLAGSYLAQLGEEDGLKLFADPATIESRDAALIGDELETIVRATHGKLRSRVEALQAKYRPAQQRERERRQTFLPAP